MLDLVNSLYGSLELSDDMTALIITVLFIFIIEITVSTIGFIKVLGSK